MNCVGGVFLGRQQFRVGAGRLRTALDDGAAQPLFTVWDLLEAAVKPSAQFSLKL